MSKRLKRERRLTLDIQGDAQTTQTIHTTAGDEKIEKNERKRESRQKAHRNRLKTEMLW